MSVFRGSGIVLPVAALAVALLLSACRDRRPQASAEEDPRVFRIGYSAVTPLHCALGEVLARTDILARHGIEAAFETFQHGSDQDRACADGSVTATFSCEVPAMVHLDRHSRFMIAGCAGSLGDVALVVAPGSPIRSVGALRGKRIEVADGASSRMLLDEWLQEAGVGQNEVTIHFASGSGEEVVRMLAERTADAGVVWDPSTTRFVQEGRVRTVAKAPFWSLVFIDEKCKGKQTDDYVAALQEALEWIALHKDEVSTWTAERSGLPKDVVRSVLGKAGLSQPSRPVAPLGDELLARLRKCEDYARHNQEVLPNFRLSDHLLTRE